MKKIDENLLNHIVEQIVPKVTQPEKIILFGSYARGEATEKSDLDILIIQPSDLPGYKRSTTVRLALKGLFPSKDIVIYTPEEVQEWESASTSFIASALREGRILYEEYSCTTNSNWAYSGKESNSHAAYVSPLE